VEEAAGVTKNNQQLHHGLGQGRGGQGVGGQGHG
jgi:hypothetical protein